ncbi:MAG: hypothetical protein IT337_03780 [Thermomicrobiales bacterium]|nr:hypothetical protein [Thermomicrobiales bacterium]
MAGFHATTLLAADEAPSLERRRAWVLDLVSGTHPGFNLRNVTIVEDTTAGKIVSPIALISQTRTYAGMPSWLGQPDVVSTDSAYRCVPAGVSRRDDGAPESYALRPATTDDLPSVTVMYV